MASPMSSPANVADQRALDTGDAVLIHDFAGKILEIDSGMLHLTGYSRAEALALNVSALLEAGSRHVLLESMLEGMGGGIPSFKEVFIRTKRGERLALSLCHRMLFVDGKPVAIQVSGRQAPHHASAAGAHWSILLHLLAKCSYGSLDEFFHDCLRAGCSLLNAPAAFILRRTGSDLVLRSFIGDENLVRKQSVSSPGVPIFVAGVPYGTLNVLGANAGPELPASGIQDLLGALAQTVGLNLAARRLRSAVALRKRLRSTGHRITSMIAAGQPLRRILQELLHFIEQRRPGSLCSIILIRQRRLLSGAAPRTGDAYRNALATWSHLDWNHPLALLDHAGQHAAAVPVTGPDGPSAILFLHAPPTRRPGPLDRSLVRWAADLAGIAIEQTRLREKTRQHENRDPLTGLLIRQRWVEILSEKLARARETGGSFAVAVLDFDRLHHVNGILGQRGGDAVLRLAARRLQRQLQPGEVLARLGGDKFGLLLTRGSPPGAAVERGRALLNQIARPYRIDGQRITVTASLGLSVFPEDAHQANALVSHAERATYQAKRQGRNIVEPFSSESGHQAIYRLELESDLRTALGKREFVLGFQPIVKLDGELDGLEALLLWKHPHLGPISPSEFIPIAEETGSILPIGRWVLEEACRQGAGWIRSGFAPLRVSVNVSPVQFATSDFGETVRRVLATTGLPASCLELELTESFVLRDPEASALRIAELRSLGIRIAIDDFGTGYSSLSYLSKLPLDTLKIDRSFLRDLAASTGSFPLVQMIVSLAHDLGLSVTAEGVETLDQLELLRAAGCDRVQGHMFGDTLGASEAENLVARERRWVQPRQSGP